MGLVSRFEGDCSPVIVPGTCIETRLRCTVRVRVLTDTTSLRFEPAPNGQKPCIESSTAGDIVAEAIPTVAGEFLLNLEPGEYTVGLVTDGCEYCNGFGRGTRRDTMCPVLVLPGEHSTYDIQEDFALW